MRSVSFFCLRKSRFLRPFSSQERSRYFPSQTTDLGLLTNLVDPHLDSIRELPEVDQALSQHFKGTDSLKRGVQVFEQIMPQSPEHLATLALLTEVLHRKGQFHSALKTLDAIQLIKNDAQTQLARAKIFYHEGHFDQCIQLCEAVMEEATNDIVFNSARTGQALAKLAAMETLDDAFAIRDYARMAVKQLPAKSLARAAAQLNYGAAEALYAEKVSKENQVDAPLDGAMRAWKEGVSGLKNKSSDVATILRTRLLTNMAWGMFEIDRSESGVKTASEYSSEALENYNAWPKEWEKEGLGRTLALTAKCYIQIEHAVTAEGLLQSALDETSNIPPVKLQLRDSYLIYGDLCRQWEKRESEGDKLAKKAMDLEVSLPNEWREKSQLFSSMWFWTPDVFE